MRHDFGFVRASALRLQRREIARRRLVRHRADRVTFRLGLAAAAFAIAAIPGRALVALAVGS